MLHQTVLPLPQKSPATFIVEDSGIQGDNSCIYMNPKAMEKLSFSEGDIIYITNKKTRKQTIGLLCQDHAQSSPIKIRLNHIFRKNLASQVNDLVQLSLFKGIMEHAKLVVKKIAGMASSASSQNHQQSALIEYFQNKYRPVCRDDIFQIRNAFGTMEFMIVHTQPSIYGIVTPNTMLAIIWEHHQL